MFQTGLCGLASLETWYKGSMIVCRRALPHLVTLWLIPSVMLLYMWTMEITGLQAPQPLGA